MRTVGMITRPKVGCAGASCRLAHRGQFDLVLAGPRLPASQRLHAAARTQRFSRTVERLSWKWLHWPEHVRWFLASYPIACSQLLMNEAREPTKMKGKGRSSGGRSKRGGRTARTGRRRRRGRSPRFGRLRVLGVVVLASESTRCGRPHDNGFRNGESDARGSRRVRGSSARVSDTAERLETATRAVTTGRAVAPDRAVT